MDVRRRKTMRAAAFAAFLVVVGILAWTFLSLFHSAYADWLRVETPRYAVAGEKTAVRVTLGEVPEPSLLVVGLYFLARDHKPITSHHASGPAPGIRSGGTYTFEFEVTPQEKLALIQFVLYLSPNGDWRDRTRGADSEVIPVKAPKKSGANPAWRKVRVYAIARTSHPETPFRPGGRPPPPDIIPAVPTPSGLVLFAFLVSGGLIFILDARRPRADRGLWLVMSGVLFVLAVWEFLRLEIRISSWGRRMAEELDLYYLRQPLQKAVIAAVIAAAAGILVLAARSVLKGRGRSRLRLAGSLVALYLGLALSGSLSFHYIDELKAVRLFGVSLVDAVKILLAAVLLAVGLSTLWKGRVRGFPVNREGNML